MFVPDSRYSDIEFPKISRFSREVIVTEKLDGKNAQIYVNDEGTDIAVGSRSQWISKEKDMNGLAAWAEKNHTELLRLGPGSHFGEWWGQGIARGGYGLKEKRFSLFNVARWEHERPTCCQVVPVLWRGVFDDLPLPKIMEDLKKSGSIAAPGFMNPEGVVIFHTHNQALFKKTFEKDVEGKGT